MRSRLVELSDQRGEPAERERDRSVSVILPDHGVARRIGREQPIEDFRVFSFGEIDADVGQHEHGRQPVPVAQHLSKLVPGQALEIRSRLVQTSELNERQLQPAAGKQD